MGTLTAETMIDRVASQLLDKNNVQWTRPELLEWLNFGIRQVVAVQPHANGTVAAVKLVAGSRQLLPADGFLLMDVIRNMGVSGDVPGRAVRAVSKQQMDAFLPAWHGDVKTTVVTNWCVDMQDPTVFYVYPPANGNGYVQINYAAVPPKLDDETDTIPVSDIYEAPLLDYMCYRAHAKRSENPYHAAAAAQYMQAFSEQVGALDSARAVNNPALNVMPRTVEVPGGAT